MIRYFIIWMAASLVMPVLVATFGRHLNETLILSFWPGSIVLMSLGAEQRPFIDAVYAWSMAIALNLVLYLVISLIILSILRMYKNHETRNKNGES